MQDNETGYPGRRDACLDAPLLDALLLDALLLTAMISGDHSGEETPVPIPNTVVKLSSAKNTAISRGGKIGRCQDI